MTDLLVVFTPPTVDVGMVRPTQRLPSRGVARIAQPMKVGQTIYKKSGTWHLVRTPTQDDLDGADPVYLGGHIYIVLQSVLDEVQAAGIDVGQTRADGTYPSATTYPSSTTYPWPYTPPTATYPSTTSYPTFYPGV